MCRALGWVSGFVVLLLQMTPRLCGGIDGPEMIELLSGSCPVCLDGLVKGNGVSLLIGHMCCLLHL